VCAIHDFIAQKVLDFHLPRWIFSFVGKRLKSTSGALLLVLEPVPYVVLSSDKDRNSLKYCFICDILALSKLFMVAKIFMYPITRNKRVEFYVQFKRIEILMRQFFVGWLQTSNKCLNIHI